MGKTHVDTSAGNAALIERAAVDIARFYHDVDVALLPNAVLLASASRDAAELSDLWKVVVANEQLHARAHPRRLELIAALA